MFPTSSRNSVPPSASSKAPVRSVFASVKAPRTWPNSSLSKTPSESPPAFTTTIALGARLLLWCSQRATTSFPVPCSPVTSTFASLGPTRSSRRSTGCMEAACATSGGKLPRSREFSSSRRRLRRSARPSSICVRSVVKRRALSHGFCT